MAAIAKWYNRGRWLVLAIAGCFVVYELFYGTITLLGFNHWWIPPLLIGVILVLSRFFTGMVRGLLVGAGVLMLMIDLNTYALGQLYPPEFEGIRVAVRDSNQMIVDHARGVEGQLQDDRSHIRNDEHRTVNLSAWWSSRKPAMNEIAEAQTLRDAALMRATRRIPIVRQPVVDANQRSWEEKFQASEPLLVTLSQNEVMCSGNRPTECWRADGIYHDGTPKWRKGSLTVMENPAPEIAGSRSNPPGSYGAVVIRTCAGGYCTGPQQTGFAFAVCPADGLTTTAMLWTNRYTTAGPTLTKADFNGDGKFTLEVLPWDHEDAGIRGLAAKQACDANPSAGFIRLTTAMTVAAN